MNYTGLIEEALKSEIYQDFFKEYNYTQLGRIDFVIVTRSTENGELTLFENETVLKSLLWAEAKQGTSHDIYESFVQLILTIGKEKTFEKYLPPKYIGAFDAEKLALIEYHDIQHIFYQNDFNWNVTPSNHGTKEFKLLFELTKELLEKNAMLFFYEKQEKELKDFVRTNFLSFSDITEKIAVTKNNFIHVFNQWLSAVKPTIAVNWEVVNKKGIISADFFLADLLSENNESLKDNLFVVLQKTKYELARKIDEETGLFDSKKVGFTDKQAAHRSFWAIYERPPKEEYWSYIIERRDLLVPQDIRERKGSFFTPKKWVELSQKYIADVLGENWQDEYYIWDCCAGTGNLLNGLVNYRNVWASTLDKADVDVMKDRINNGGWKMFENHVFQFDFLNDDFAKCPKELFDILTDEDKRKKLVIYINPPYAEASTTRTKTGTGENKAKVATETKVYEKYQSQIGTAARELFAQFLIRVNAEIQRCKLAQFATLKALCASNFAHFRDVYQAKLEKLFVVPANTFDNVKGQFPIGFFIWDGDKPETFEEINADVFDSNGSRIGTKLISSYSNDRYVIDWLRQYHDKQNPNVIGFLRMVGTDVQNSNGVFITSNLSDNDFKKKLYTPITANNLIQTNIYCVIRHVIEPTWLNDRDQFLYPKDEWEADKEFQLDCLVYGLFMDANNVKSEHGINHWIPFTEDEVGSKKAFASDFMAKFLRDFKAGKISVSAGDEEQTDLFADTCHAELDSASAQIPKQVRNDKQQVHNDGVAMSTEASSVYSAGLELWRYYFAAAGDGVNENASFYDIRKYFQGTDEKGRMNNKSSDEKYNALIDDLRAKQKKLASKIAEKVYDYGFLRR